ncbi:ABC transporter substrate-binding protein [Cytophagaceae bacterium ABcell3]|nr:ABC transporter substrate-binding protein [Cytophagaceae bacterium ABcell3]
MKKLVLSSFLCTALFFSSCNPSQETSSRDQGLREAKGGKYYGEVLNINESDYFKNLFPHHIIDAISYRIATQVYEGLLKFNPEDLTLMKGLAEDYTVDASNTVYTFKLKKGVKFHDDECFEGGKGRELTAEDIKYCFTLLCTYDANNQGFTVFKDILKGANEYYAATKANETPKEGVEGIKVIDKYTIQFTLTEPNSIFVYNLARPFTFIFPKEAVNKYGLDMRSKAVGTGPFTIHHIDEGTAVILKKNEAYHGTDIDGNKLPYLDGIKVRFIRDRKTELLEFKKGNLHMMYRLPTDYIIEILEEAKGKKGEYGKYELQSSPEMATHIYAFLHEGVFDNINVRKAMSFAIDRNMIKEAVLNGDGFAAGYHGITPPTFLNRGYDIEKIRGYNKNLDSARYYLKKAGYPDGKGFPKIVLDLNADGERNIPVAEEIKKQLKENLNINMELNLIPHAQLVEKMVTGQSQFFRVGWIADYPNPENFLWLFYGKTVPEDKNAQSYPNMLRYKNDKFDELYEKGLNAKSDEEAFAYFMKAENALMEDAPAIMLWYDEGYNLLQREIKNFHTNAMQYRDFSEVYITPAQEPL